MKKKIIMVLLGLLMFIPLSLSAFSNEGCGGDCTQCHKLERKEAEEVIGKLKKGNNIPANAKLQDIKLSPVGGLWQMELEVGEKRGMLYLDFSKKNLVLGQIVPVEAIGTPPAPQKVDFSKLPLEEAVIVGSKKAKNKIVVFTDPDCPYCRKLHDEMKKVLAGRNDVAFYLILFPLEFHKDAYKKVQAILCEKSQKLVDDAMAGLALPEPKCSNEQVERNKALAKSLKFTGTPTMVRSDGTVNFGTLPADRLIEWIDGK